MMQRFFGRGKEQGGSTPAEIWTPNESEAGLVIHDVSVVENRSGIIINGRKELRKALEVPGKRMARAALYHLTEHPSWQTYNEPSIKIDRVGGSGYILFYSEAEDFTEEDLAHELGVKRGLSSVGVNVEFKSPKPESFAIDFDDVLTKIRDAVPTLQTGRPISGNLASQEISKGSYPFFVGIDGKASLNIIPGFDMRVALTVNSVHHKNSVLFGNLGNRLTAENPSFGLFIFDANRNSLGHRSDRNSITTPVTDLRVQEDMLSLAARVAEAFRPTADSQLLPGTSVVLPTS